MGIEVINSNVIMIQKYWIHIFKTCRAMIEPKN